MYGEAVVLDQNGLWRQLITVDQVRDRLRFTRIYVFAIE